MNTVIRITAMAIAGVLVSCGKDTEAPSKFIEKQSGNWRIEHWEKKHYSGGAVTSTESADDIGTVMLQIHNLGFYSEGDYEPSVQVNSDALNFMSINAVCYDTYRWNCDKHRLNFSLGWCDWDKDMYTFTIDGWGKNKQTWTWIKTDNTSAMVLKETWQVRRD